MNKKIKNIISFWIVTVCRLCFAATFIVSGFVKAADPLGMLYKTNAYFSHWGHPFEDNSTLLSVFVVALSALEFMLGIYILLGIRKRTTTIVAFVTMLCMTALTAYIYIYNPVNRFKPVTYVRQSSCHDYRHGVVYIGGFHFLLNIHFDYLVFFCHYIYIELFVRLSPTAKLRN